MSNQQSDTEKLREGLACLNCSLKDGCRYKRPNPNNIQCLARLERACKTISYLKSLDMQFVKERKFPDISETAIKMLLDEPRLLCKSIQQEMKEVGWEYSEPIEDI